MVARAQSLPCNISAAPCFELAILCAEEMMLKWPWARAGSIACGLLAVKFLDSLPSGIVTAWRHDLVTHPILLLKCWLWVIIRFHWGRSPNLSFSCIWLQGKNPKYNCADSKKLLLWWWFLWEFQVLYLFWSYSNLGPKSSQIPSSFPTLTTLCLFIKKYLLRPICAVQYSSVSGLSPGSGQLIRGVVSSLGLCSQPFSDSLYNCVPNSPFHYLLIIIIIIYCLRVFVDSACVEVMWYLFHFCMGSGLKLRSQGLHSKHLPFLTEPS